MRHFFEKTLDINLSLVYNYCKKLFITEKVGVVVTKSTGRRSIILAFFVITILCFSIGLFAWLNIDSNEKQIKLDFLNAQYQQLQQENDEKEYLLENADEAELYEHLARERGYVYPDEKVFYDVTPGN
ncbi:MAG: hypothetical protein E7573_01615 [Ruminococcaceae bacterium]|nr:hypothetical protein [Oscillospiraceae bacterium]